MPDTTEYLKLEKPFETENYNINVFNQNADKLDAACATLQDGLETANAELGNKANKSGVYQPSLLNNGDFQVWQGGTSFTALEYTADCWLNGAAEEGQVRVEKMPTGLKATIISAPIKGSNVLQRIEFPEKYVGKTLTLSVDCFTTGTYRGVYIGYALEGQELTYRVSPIKQGQRETVVLTVEIPPGIKTLECGIGLTRPILAGDAGTYTEMYSAKLEYGAVATAFTSRPYGEELTRCQRYRIRLGNAATMEWVGSGIADVVSVQAFIPLPVTMRAIPVLAGAGIIKAWVGTENYTLTKPRINVCGNNGVHLSAEMAEKLPTGTPVFLNLGANQTVMLDANL